MVLTPYRNRSIIQKQHYLTLLLTAVIGLIVLWGASIAYLLSSPNALKSKSSRSFGGLRSTAEQRKGLVPKLLSRSDGVTATADVRGNLGPSSVVIQKDPGTDWIKDRWQAASNMHGTAIKGAHWVKLDFGREIVIDRVVLDWEAAYATQYKLEGSPFDLSDDDGAEKLVLFDGTDPSQEHRRTSVESGQSPGVDTKTPLHVVHTIDGFSQEKPIRYLRVFVYRSVMGWGGKFVDNS